MIEFLSNSDWISPQIDFLLILQNIRVSHFNMFDNLFLSITAIGEFWLPTLICALVYWCVDFKSGIYLFSLSAYNVFFAQLFKMIACVYRPWVLSDKIQPVKKALALAIGYSFPSGHSAQASALLGGIALLVRKKIFISILLVILVLIVGFSRLWLGVHTPQDVVIGLLIGFSLVFILNSMINWAEKNTNRYLYIFGVTNILILIALIYICYFNSYPIDYVNGKLLVNPYGSIHTTVWCYGYIAGILDGIFICRRFFPFNPHEYSLKTKITKAIIGSIVAFTLVKFASQFLTSGDYNFKITFMVPFICGIFITAVFPYIFYRIKIIKNV